MKTLKKVLAVVLALAMVLGMTSMASAAFAGETIKYKEAVDVMNALGVLEGDNNGKFNPTEILTREQAAKIISYMLLGKAAADVLPATKVFSDVKADRWSAGAIAYGYAQGILAGEGAGKFNPTGKLTGYAFAKMCLTALGYDAEVEGLTGTNWSANVAKLVASAGLNAGMTDVLLSAEMTREQAAQMAFNTEKATMVAYQNGVSVTTGATTVKVNAIRNDVAQGTVDYTTNATTGDTAMQFCEQYATKLTLTSSSDNFGRTSKVWANDGKKIGEYASTAKFVYTADMNTTAGKAQIKADLKGYNNYEHATETVAVIKNGKAAASEIKITVDNVADLTGNGTAVEIFVSNNAISKIVVVKEVLAKVDSVSTANETITLKTVATNVSQYGSTTQTFTTTEGYGTFVKGDYVVITAYGSTEDTLTAGDAVATVKAATKVKGIATTFNKSAKTITVAGTTYKEALGVAGANDVDAFGVSAKYDATLYLDQYGYVVYAKAGAAATSDKLLVVTKVYSTLVEGVVTPTVKGVISNGTEVVWYYDDAAADGPGLTKGDIMLYKYNTATDLYELTDVDSSGATDSFSEVDDHGTTYADTYVMNGTLTTTKATKSIYADGEFFYFTDDVKFIYVNASDKVTVVDGVQKLEGVGTQHFAVKKSDSKYYITAVVIDNTDAPSTATTSDDIVYVAYNDSTASGKVVLNKDNVEKTYTTYKAYINGEKVDGFYGAAGKAGFYYANVDADTQAYLLDAGYTTSTGTMAVATGLIYVDYAGDKLVAKNAAQETLTFTVDKIVDTKSADGTACDTLAEMKTKDAVTNKSVVLDVIYNANTGVAECVYVRDYEVSSLATATVKTTPTYDLTWNTNKFTGTYSSKYDSVDDLIADIDFAAGSNVYVTGNVSTYNAKTAAENTTTISATGTYYIYVVAADGVTFAAYQVVLS